MADYCEGIREEFRRDPLAEGWTTGAREGGGFDGQWLAPSDAEPGHVTVRSGWWASPAVGAEPFAYMRIAYEAKAAGPGFCFAEFLGENGARLETDCCDGLEPSDVWREREFHFRVHPIARGATVRFEPIEGEMRVRGVRLERSDAASAGAWLDRLAEEVPAPGWSPPPDRAERLGRTFARLGSGGRLRIVMLGDSIVNDAGSSLFELLVARERPGARIEVVNSSRGGTGCWHYREGGRVGEYVLRHEPDLVMIGGISHRGDAEAVRDVVGQVRSGSEAEVLLMTGAVGPYETSPERAYEEALRRVADQTGSAFLDVRAAWDAYVSGPGAPRSRLMRDEVHANSGGKRVLGEILARYFGA